MQDPGTCQTKETRESISRKLELWEAGIHARLVGDKEAEGAARDRRVER